MPRYKCAYLHSLDLPLLHSRRPVMPLFNFGFGRSQPGRGVMDNIFSDVEMRDPNLESEVRQFGSLGV